jgi:glutamine amidotransferase PdxT
MALQILLTKGIFIEKLRALKVKWCAFSGGIIKSRLRISEYKAIILIGVENTKLLKLFETKQVKICL